jgi:hypothetical protein
MKASDVIAALGLLVGGQAVCWLEATYLEWLDEAGLAPVWHRCVPEGDGGHTLVLARAV